MMVLSDLPDTAMIKILVLHNLTSVFHVKVPISFTKKFGVFNVESDKSLGGWGEFSRGR